MTVSIYLLNSRYSPDIFDSPETHTAIPNPNRKNWSGEVVPTPLSLIKPASIRGFQPSHLVVLAGKEVGIFTL